MNLPGLLRDAIVDASTTSPWAWLLVKVTLLLAAAWLAHFALARANPRWRTLLWRGVAVGAMLLAVWSLGLPGVEIRMTPPEPIAAASVPSTPPEDAEREPVVLAPDSVDPGEAPVLVEPTITAPQAADRDDHVAAETAPPIEPSLPVPSWRAVLVGIWACGVVVLALRLAIACWALVGSLRHSQPVRKETILQAGRIAAALGCPRPVWVRSSAEFSVPFLWGFWRPILVLPERMCQPLYRRQLPGILVHELAHVASRDCGWNAALQAVSILLWFHPLAWRIGAAHRGACDAVCDAVSAAHLGNVEDYCRTLARVALECAGKCPATGLAMARTCDVRRRIAALRQRVFATALGRRTVAAVSLAGLVSLALFAGVRVALAESSEESKETDKPVTMSAEEFGRLPAAEQRAILVREFQRRVEHAKNLYYESDEIIKHYTNRDGKPGEPLEGGAHGRFRRWLLGDSFRADEDQYRNLTDAEPSGHSCSAVNAEEGLGRSSSIDKDGKQPPRGSIGFPFEHAMVSRYSRWIPDRAPSDAPGMKRVWSLFLLLLDQTDQFTIEAPVEGDKVRLTMSSPPGGADAPRTKNVYLLDPRKGFLPVRCESRYEAPATRERHFWYEETSVVEESRLVHDVWMPIKIRETYAVSRFPERISVWETTALAVDFGTVKPSDIRVRFAEGMKIVDVIDGVEYVANAEGNPAGTVKVARGWQRTPPEGWQRRKPTSIPSMASRLSAADREVVRLDEQQKAERRESLASALAVLRAGPATPTDERVEAGLKILRTYSIGENEALWAGAIRELILIGKPAVPRLVEELDRTERDETQRGLAFVLRGIGDRRAVPAMIRAIPRLLQPPRSGYGLLIENDPELAKFMKEHDNDPQGTSTHFSYGRPIGETMAALEKMTGQTHGWKDLIFVYLEGGAEQRRLQRTLFLKLAERWTDWWSKHWRDYVDNEADAQLDLTQRALEQYAASVAAMPSRPRTDFPCGPNVLVEGGSHNTSIQAFDQSPSRGFADLDTRRWPVPPEELVRRCADHKPSEELLAWAEREGVDIIYVQVSRPGGEPYYAIQPVGMKVWRITNGRFDGLQEELRRNTKLDLPASWKGPLAQLDERTGAYDEKLTASFLFITREGVCGAVQIRPPMSRPSSPGTPVEISGGVLYRYVYEDSEKK